MLKKIILYILKIHKIILFNILGLKIWFKVLYTFLTVIKEFQRKSEWWVIIETNYTAIYSPSVYHREF